jgi:hypothetical protein
LIMFIFRHYDISDLHQSRCAAAVTG